MCKNVLDIIIPAYNAQNWINRCLDSLIKEAKSFPGVVSIIVINDGSTDNTLNLITEYSIVYDFIKVHSTENCGVSMARNYGLNVSSAAWITFVDSDDYLLPGYIVSILNQINLNKGVDCFIYNYYLGFKNGEMRKNRILASSSLKSFEVVNKLLCGEISNSPFDKVFRKEVLDSLRFAGGVSVGEDLLFAIQFFLKAENVLIIGESYYVYFHNENSVTKMPITNKKIDDIFFVVMTVLNLVEKKFSIKSRNIFVYSQLLGYLISRKFLYFIKHDNLFGGSVKGLELSDISGLKKKTALIFLKIFYWFG